MRLIIEIAIHFGLLAVLTYIIREIVEFIPFPLDKVFGYDHNKLREFASGTYIFTTIMLTQSYLKDKIFYTIKKIYNEKNIK